ncbi:hypothetical protein AB9P05_22180 [Roseivirga sp. BDSF3-8]|uniref:hypothetical protein n=1 Tax=Roseivirga sp. BDSF3-8 TaxID=3241598 RepID=UPI00353202FE
MHLTLAIISTLFILVPLLTGLGTVKRAGMTFRLFVLFLLAGFVTDCLSWYKNVAPGVTTEQGLFIDGLYQLYSALEAAFFFWFISAVASPGWLHKAARYALWLTVPVWLVIGVFSPFRGLFDATYQVLVAFLSAGVLLQYIEREPQPLRQPHFILLAGIFFYTLSTFVIVLLAKTPLADQLWFLHNAVNILTYVVYTVGFALQIKTGAVQTHR